MRNIIKFIFVISLIPNLCLGFVLGQVHVEGITDRSIELEAREFLGKTFSTLRVDELIAKLYRTNKYSQIEVYSEFDQGLTNLWIKLTPVRLLKGISIIGNSAFSNSTLESETKLIEGAPLTSDKMKAAVEAINKYYNLNGFLSSKVSASVKPSKNSQEVELIFEVQENEACLIANLEFQSTNVNLNNKLQSKFKSFVKDRYTEATLNQAYNEIVDYLIKEKYYSANVSAPQVDFNQKRSEVNLKFLIDDPFQYSLTFEGNQTYSSSHLIKQLKLDSGNRLSTSPIEDLTDRLTKLYRADGFANVKILPTVKYYESDFTKSVWFKIQEGHRVKISEIRFDGKLSRPQDYYVKYLKNNSGEQTAKGYYFTDEIENGIVNLVTSLQNEGYITAKQGGYRVEFDKLRENIKIKIALDEGVQTHITKIEFRGIKAVSAVQLESAVGLSVGQPLRLISVEESFKKISEYYRARGYLDAQILNQGKSIISYHADNSEAALNYEIREGPQVIVKEIVIEGNDATEDFVISRELTFKPGDILTPEIIYNSEENIRHLSLFSEVSIRPIEESSNEGRRRVLITVVEGNPGVFNWGVGVNNELDISLKGFSGAAYRNLWGTGRGINGRVELTEKYKYDYMEYDANFGYFEPYILGTNNNGRLALNKYSKIKSIDIGQQGNTKTEKVFAVESTLGSAQLERDFTKHLKLLFEIYGFAHTNTFNIRDRNESTPLDIATTGPTLVLDLFNDPLNPTRGFKSTFGAEYSHPVLGSSSTVNYVRALVGHTHLIPIGKWVWANHGRLGYVKNLSDLSDGAVPQIKGFSLGGRTTIRGFDPQREAFPNDIEGNFAKGLKTDSFVLLAKSELRFPISGNFGGLFFYDGGKVGFPEYHPIFDWRDSVGVGIRYITPVGPVSAEYGYKLNRDQTRLGSETEGHIHVSIGDY